MFTPTDWKASGKNYLSRFNRIFREGFQRHGFALEGFQRASSLPMKSAGETALMRESL